MMRRVLFLCFALLPIALWNSDVRFPYRGSEAFDLVIRGGRVLDGSGNPWFEADVGIRGGRISAIGDLRGVSANRVIDAGGKYVVPGFIDIHSHSDDGITNPDLRFNLNMIAQGITLSVLNQDGRNPQWPVRDQKARYESMKIGNNVALMVGHGTLRNMVMRQRSHEPATDSDIREMQKLAEEGMRDGAFGISTGLEYVPGRYSEPREVVELTRVIRPFGGFYISHERSEGKGPYVENGIRSDSVCGSARSRAGNDQHRA